MTPRQQLTTNAGRRFIRASRGLDAPKPPAGHQPSPEDRFVAELNDEPEPRSVSWAKARHYHAEHMARLSVRLGYDWGMTSPRGGY